MSQTNYMPTMGEIDPNAMNVSQFSCDPLNNRVSIQMSDMTGGSIQLYTQPVEVETGGTKEQIKVTALAYLERTRKAIEAL